MLKLYIGPAGSGKTAAVMDEIRRRVLAQAANNWLIVPEQYSHEAERELCLRCGDTMSRYAEVFSFSGLARRVLSEQGGAALPVLDKGGRLLCMSLALAGVGERLRAYKAARRRPEFPALMLSAADELKTADDPQAKRAELEEKYMADVADGVNAAAKGYVDDVIEPAQTRQILAAALEMLSGKRENKPAKKHGNMPL